MMDLAGLVKFKFELTAFQAKVVYSMFYLATSPAPWLSTTVALDAASALIL